MAWKRKGDYKVGSHGEFYTVGEVCSILSVHPKTVLKWLSPGDPTKALVDPSDWFRLPGGAIRVQREAVLKITREEVYKYPGKGEDDGSQGQGEA